MDAKRGVLCLFLLLLLFPDRVSLQQADLLATVYVNCTHNTTSLSSTFTQNLKRALRNFTSLSKQGTKYAATIVGSSGQDDMVYAAFQCRGDLQSCWGCMQNATVRLPDSDCPKSLGARIRLDGCFLRYSNDSFFELDTTYMAGLCNPHTTSNLLALSYIQNVVENATSEAPKQSNYFASVSDSADGFYGAAQCLGYLNQSECSRCLPSYSYRELCDTALGGQVHLASCWYRYEAKPFLEAASPAPPLSSAPRLSPDVVASSKGAPRQSHIGSNKPITIIILSVVVGVVGAPCGILLLWHYKARKIKGVKRLNKAASWSQRQLLQMKAQVFSLEELEEATAYFHSTNKLGEGGFGIVYKGTLLSGEQVAIKKLSIGSQQGKQEFLNEVSLITNVQHKNLIRLLGCCVDGPEKILVYEYLPNKSLDFFLYGDARERRMLNWSTRYNIIIGMAKGLAYLHEEAHVQIIHRDIKPSNILLDDQLNPVIADFGLARLVNHDATHVSTGVAGTIGYLAPEYAIRGALSGKVDVFSFGLVCLELITGKRNVHSMLLTWVWERYLQEKALDLVDENLGNAFCPQQVIHVLHVALLCTQENPKQRPTMFTVILWLSGTSTALEKPIRPTFLDYNVPIVPMGERNQSFTSAPSTSSQSNNVSSGQVPGVSGGLQSLSEINPR